ncbi:MAG: type I restriction enzyme HsdR N-terminal domain-containing protein [Candidatus Acidiferrum sp.]
MSVDIRHPLKKLIPILLKAKEENLNEADTVQRIMMVFQNVLGYDPLTEITREMPIKTKYVDLALKIDGVIKLLVEAKAAGCDLRDRHIEQAKSYAAESNLRWVVLTNGVNWNLYHLSFEEGIDTELVFSLDLAADDMDKAAECLALLHEQNVRKGEHEDFWKKRTALDAQSLGRALYTDTVLRLIRREIRKSEGLLLDEEDLAKAIHDMLSEDAREKMGPMKIRRKRQHIPKKTETNVPSVNQEETLVPQTVGEA